METVDSIKREKLFELIRSVGQKLLNLQPKDSCESMMQALKILKKGDGSLVTAADILANSMLTEGISRLFPQDSLISEETPIDSKVRSAKRVWIIDPLDGTKSFVEGLDDFCVLVALVIENAPHAAYAYFPARNRFLHAYKGEGSLVNEQRMRTSNSAAIRESGIYIHNLARAIDDPRFSKEWMHSGEAFFRLCMGDFDAIVIKMGKLQEWDLAAPVLLVQECGGKVTDERGGDIKFNQEKIYYSYLVASNGIVHDEVLRTLEAIS